MKPGLSQMPLILMMVVTALSGCDLAKSLLGRKPPRTAERMASSDRSPASIERVYDYSYLAGSALETAAKNRLAQSVRVEITDDKKEAILELGNFVLLNDKSEKQFACGFFDRIIFQFVATGMAIDGEPPRLSIDVPCEVGSDINQVVPIRVPIGKVQESPAKDDELTFFDEKHRPMRVQLHRSPGQWPTHWVLNEVRLSHSSRAPKALRVDSGLLRDRRKNTAMTW